MHASLPDALKRYRPSKAGGGMSASASRRFSDIAQGAGQARPRPARRAARADPAHGRAGAEGSEARHGADRHGAQRHRFRCLRGHRRPSGRSGAHFRSVCDQLYQAPVRGASPSAMWSRSSSSRWTKSASASPSPSATSPKSSADNAGADDPVRPLAPQQKRPPRKRGPRFVRA